jgi:KUP system potassium uptake protein
VDVVFVRTRDYDLLAGILLCVTGCEALFANLGQFNAASIRLSFCTVTYPALVLAYLGQGARLIHDGDVVISNVFYQAIPGKPNGPLFWIIWIFGLLATLTASQALITATFSLVQQLVNMKSLPPLSMVYTSETIQGQVYIPSVNWIRTYLLTSNMHEILTHHRIVGLVCLIVVGVFEDLAAMTNAYGFAVATVMFTTTVMIAIQMRYVKGWPIASGLIFFVVFGFFDGVFWGASLRKVPHGAWVPLMIGIIL